MGVVWYDVFVHMHVQVKCSQQAEDLTSAKQSLQRLVCCALVQCDPLTNSISRAKGYTVRKSIDSSFFCA